MARQRIEYIDAMRGFTMILVVYSHVCRYCLGDAAMGFNDVFFVFRLPCFFFISGLLFWPKGDLSMVENPRQQFSVVARHKFMVQIVPTFIFLLLLAPPPVFFSRLGATKGGYWFTFALFEFFLFYLLSSWVFRRSRRADLWMLLVALVLSVAGFYYDVRFNAFFSHWGWATKLLGFIGLMTWRYYVFFFFGALFAKYFSRFETLISNGYFITFLILVFLLVWFTLDYKSLTIVSVRFFLGGVCGLLLVFSFFRRFAFLFVKKYLLGCSLQYIGCRTLDIYLLHYFFLPRFLLSYAEPLRQMDSRLLEFVVAMALALVITSLCLLASRLIRLSPLLGHYLFGVKYEKAA